VKDYILNLDKPRKLKFGFKASRLIREKFGDEDFSDLENINIDDMPAFAWAGLIWEDEELTVEKVEELLDAKISDEFTILDSMNIIVAAFAAHMGVEPVKKKTKKQPKKKIPTKKKESKLSK